MNEYKFLTNYKKSNYILLKEYLNKLEYIHNKANTPTKKELLRSLYYSKYIIKKEYLNKQIKNNKKRNIIIEEQKKSLYNWIDYLENNKEYPLFIKYYIF